MGIDIHTQVLIRRPRAEVAAYMFDPANEARWTTGVVESRPLTPGRLRAGSKVERVTKFLGRQFGYVYEVVAAGGDDYVQIRVDNPFPMNVRYELEDAPEGTIARIRTSGEAGGFFKIAAPLLGGMVRKNITRDLEMLRDQLEQRRS